MTQSNVYPDENAGDNPLEIAVELALAEYMIKCDSGVAPNREQFLAQHASMREHLSELLAAADWIEQMAGPTLADSKANIEVDRAAEDPSIDETLPVANPAWRPVVSDQAEATEVTLPVSLSDNRDFSVGEVGGHGAGKRKTNLRSAAELSQPILPCRFGDYVLERVLGRGGMGVVYFGRQIHLDRPVAIKMIRSGALASQEEVQRFYAEARSAAKLDHPNIVTVYQCGEQDGHHYFSMDFVPGNDLSHLVEKGPVDGKLAARYVRDVARAIQYAHDRGILHRDLKPANVLIDESQNVHVTDFGLAKFIGHESGLTAEGAALGTPSYMSPEQAAGRTDEQSFATDVYSMGAVLFTIVTGQPPFKAKSIVQTIMHVIHRPAPLARTINASVHADIETVIDRCLQKSPERRYPSATALADDLERFLRNQPIEARRLPAWRRVWHWLLGIPIVGAVLDNRVVEPTDAHRWVQRGLIASALLLITAWGLFLFSSNSIIANRLPKTVRIAAGAAGGGYEKIANSICAALATSTSCEATILNTEGSLDNIERLLGRKADLALLQANSVHSSAIAVVAPLYYEAVHVLVRNDIDVHAIEDLRGKRVLLGSEKSGAHEVAKLILERANLQLGDVSAASGDWRGITEQPEIDAAIVVIQMGNPGVQKVLASGQHHLVSIVDAMDFSLEEPMFHALRLTTTTYPECNLPVDGVLTIATTAFLAARPDAPDVLVEKVLNCLYLPETIADCRLLPAERAAHWQGLAWHPAASRFYGMYR